MLFFPGNYFHNFRVMLNAISSSDTSSLFQPTSISLSSLLRRVECLISTQKTCNVTTYTWGWTNSSLANISIALLLIAVAIFVIKTFKNNLAIEFSCLAGLIIIAIPTAQIYNLVLSIPIIGLLLRPQNLPRKKTQRVERALMFVAACTATTGLPVALAYLGDSAFSSGDGGSPFFRLNYWTTPTFWTLLFISLFYLAAMESRFHREIQVETE
jgi:hypothetical protein